ncbi:MAG: class I SAM-dependent rRNA methyltransferase [Anaerolineae bacterium]
MTPHIPRVVLKRGREAAVLRRHPWIFSGSVADVQGNPVPGALVAVHSSRDDFLAWGHYSPHSQIRVRLISWNETSLPEGADFWRYRLQRAMALRQRLAQDPSTTAYRLLHAESDGVPGLIVDRYNDVLVTQFLTTGVDIRKELLADLLWEETGVTSIYERSDVDARDREGLPYESGVLRGTPPPETFEIHENGLAFLVDVRSGHKTGFYLDQRPNRQRFRDMMCARATHPAVLNVFAYTGGFALYALSGGATSVVNVETSAEALALGHDNVRRNELDVSRMEDIKGDAFEVLRDLRRDGRKFDAIVLDPPKFAHTRRDIQGASRGYKDINMQAIHLLQPAGLLFTFSCSGVISDDLFQKIVFGAALDTERDVQIIGKLMQGSDHPVALTFPEGAYLKGLICRVMD